MQMPRFSGTLVLSGTAKQNHEFLLTLQQNAQQKQNQPPDASALSGGLTFLNLPPERYPLGDLGQEERDELPTLTIMSSPDSLNDAWMHALGAGSGMKFHFTEQGYSLQEMDFGEKIELAQRLIADA